MGLSELRTGQLKGTPAAVIAVPACNEAERLEACLTALATQRDNFGAPVEAAQFEILVFANNSNDGTADLAAKFAQKSPHPLRVIEEQLPAHHANAGWARKRAMDLAAACLMDHNRTDGIILTTDADSCVSPTWFANNMREFGYGADCVAGYVDANPIEMMRLSPAFIERGRVEDHYLRLMAEIDARCDPRPHDPWPNHRVSSGASLAVTLAAYIGIGGLPPRAVGEDAALTAALERSGYRVRHSMAVSVSTSCRFDGRVSGGAADTMHYRHNVPDAPCDDAVEAAFPFTRRMLCKGRLRRMSQDQVTTGALLQTRLRLDGSSAERLIGVLGEQSFLDFWEALEMSSPVLQQRTTLRPSALPREISRAEAILSALRSRAKSVQADRPSRPGPDGPIAAGERYG